MNEILRCFRVLGVQPGAHGKVVKKAYRDLVKKWHPDQFGDDPTRRNEAEEKLREINIAFERIRNTPAEELSRAFSPKPAPRQPEPKQRRPAPDSNPTSARSTKRPTPRKKAQPQPPKPTDSGPVRRPVKKARRSMWEVAFAIVLVAGVMWLWYALLVPSETVQKRPTVRIPPPSAPRTDLAGTQDQADVPLSYSSAPRSEVSNGADGGSGGRIVSNSDGAAADVGGTGEITANSISGLAALAGQAPGNPLVRPESFTPRSLDNSRESVTLPDSGPPAPVLSEALRAAITPPPVTVEVPAPSMTETAEADFQRGIEFAEGRGVARNYEQAAVWYRRAAEGGHPGAQRRLGLLYATGRGVEQDSGEAETWLGRSAGGGDADASLVNGLLVLARSTASETKPVVRSETATPSPESGRSALFKELMNRADGGAANPPATVSESDTGKNTPPVETDPERQYERGLRHATGEGVNRDYSESAKWFRMAADAGHAEAQKQLGLLYASGKGVPQDYLEAEKWLRKAAEKGAVGAVLSKGGASKEPSSETKSAPASEIAVDPLKKGS
jgi:TPR repeat protein